MCVYARVCALKSDCNFESSDIVRRRSNIWIGVKNCSLLKPSITHSNALCSYQCRCKSKGNGNEPNRPKLLFSLSNWFASLYLRCISLHFCVVCNEMTRENKMQKGKHCHFMAESGVCNDRGSGSLICAVAKAEKVVSSCFLHCNANTYKYMQIFGMQWIYQAFVWIWQNGAHSNDEGTFLWKLYSETMRCVFAAMYMHFQFYCRVIKAHKNLYACVCGDNNFCIFVMCAFGSDTLAGVRLNIEIQS